MSQFDLALPPAPKSQIDMAERVRPKLDGILDALGRHGGAEWTERELRRYRLMVPQMCRWLPEAEAERILAVFGRQFPNTA